MQSERLYPNPAEIPNSTAFKAGYLVTKNAGWRSVRPVIDAGKCVKCQQCYLYCPDGTISPEIAVDYDFCKGCGICAKACRLGAITMIPERGDADA
ncbi:MAG: 4Fe-4S binding protein [Oscillospiraceae bacterium]|jgi:2-oxoacid:acceptor oxidoreductase delta subunit (pyruvate/2-ketoisovalerate family)|nr:4Fe-4S binding protein [Oscillospiraceae bacterium]